MRGRSLKGINDIDSELLNINRNEYFALGETVFDYLYWPLYIHSFILMHTSIVVCVFLYFYTVLLCDCLCLGISEVQ